ncbi:MAG: DUF4145 domain-containing protein [Candidatus Aminicenantes bacterium]|nr:MAG: DUF4145 domain-containing protein [Candidatus Aminicenantes bacterium]
MSVQINALYAENLGTHTTNVDADKLPDDCPICHNGIKVQHMTGWLSNGKLQAVFCCPKEICQGLFIAYYEKRTTSATGPVDNVYYLKGVEPYTPKKRKFSKVIEEISKEFCDFYNEAFEAEDRKLLNICGAGYRKATEFLIKDYLIKVKSKKPEEIRETPLGKCIEDYIEDDNTKKCAKRAVWIGNDETHYIRKWEEKDLQDLKDLIDVTLFWIESEYKTKRYTIEMPEKNR